MEDTKVRKPRVAKAAQVPEKIETGRVTLSQDEARALYKVLDKSGGGLFGEGNLTSKFTKAQFVNDLVWGSRGVAINGTEEFQIDISNILMPAIVIKDFPPTVDKPVREPRAAKAEVKVDLPKAVIRKAKE